MNELQAKLGPLPLWGWLVAGAGMGVLALLFWRRQGAKGPGSTLGQSQQSGQPPNFNYSPLDPLTGTPYSVESQVNPNTGLPNYYNQPPGQQPPPVRQPPAQQLDDATAAWRTLNPGGGTTPPAAFVSWWQSGHQGPPPAAAPPMIGPGPGGVNPPAPPPYPQQPVGWPKTAGY